MKNTNYTKMGKFLFTGVADGTGHTFTSEPKGVAIPAKSFLNIDMNQVAFLHGLAEKTVADLAAVTANSKKSK